MIFNKKGLTVIIPLMLLLNIAQATPAPSTCEPSDWNCHGPAYFTAGYVLVHVIYTSHQDSFAPPGQSAIPFTTQNNFPNNLNGFRIGFGGSLVPNTPLGYEIGYIQTPALAKTTQNLQVSVASKAITADFAYALNPTSRFPVRLFAGALVASIFTTQSTVAPNAHYATTTNNVDVQPFVGFAVAYQFNARAALKFVVPYSFVSYSHAAHSNLFPGLMFIYYPFS
ncbi:MAG: hypothetical protein NTW94_05155 [Legionellales bacterium]|nr:hypothetical protein [Legionellales bacterium]